MLHKAQLSKSDLMQEFVARWVSQNFDDLLSETEKKPFKNLFYYAKQSEVMSWFSLIYKKKYYEKPSLSRIHWYKYVNQWYFIQTVESP